MKDGINSTADPEKENLSNLLLSGEDLNIAEPSFPVETKRRLPWKERKGFDSRTEGKLRFDLVFASDERITRKCPVCGARVLIGPSYKDHVHFCQKVQP